MLEEIKAFFIFYFYIMWGQLVLVNRKEFHYMNRVVDRSFACMEL